MKKTLICLALIVGLFGAGASVGYARTSVKGYLKKSGTYVMPYHRTSPNTSKFDNWSTKGNYNPYTGKKGTVSPFKW